MLQHTIPASEKDRKWRVGMAKQYITGTLTNYYDQSDLQLMAICAGKADYTRATYLTNPYGLRDPKYQNYPAKLRNHDFISPIFRRLRAMWSERNSDPTVYTRDSTFNSEVSQQEMGMINQSLQQRFVNSLIASGQFDPMMAQQQQQQPPMSEEVIQNEKKSIKDAVTIEGQHVLNYVIASEDLKPLYRDVWGTFTQINKCATYKDVRRDRIIVHKIDTDHLRYKGNKNTRYLEDAEVIVARFKVTYTEILEMFQQEFDKPEYKREYPNIIEELEKKILDGTHTNTGTGQSSISNTDWFTAFNRNMGRDSVVQSMFEDPVNTDVDESLMGIIDHLQYTSYRKVGKVWNDETQDFVHVTEDYLGDDVLDWEWHPEQREMWIIDEHYYIGGYPVPFTPRDPDNPFYTKKSYNGRIFMQGKVTQVKLPEVMQFYQESYDAVKWKIQTMINKNKDKLAVLPIGLLGHFKNTTNTGYVHHNGDLDDDGQLKGKYNPNLETGVQDSAIAKSLYYADTTQFLFVDETSETAQIAAQMIKEIDLGLGNYIQYLMNYAREIREEAEELVGFNRYMMARTSSSDAVTNVSNGQYLSSLVLEEYFTEFEEFVNKEYQGILDRSGYAFREGMKRNYVRDNTDVMVMQVTGALARHVFGVFTRSGAKTKELTDTLKMKANEMIQNGMPVSVVAKIITGTMNFAETIANLENAERMLMETRQQEMESANQTAVQVQQMKDENDQKNRDVKVYDIDMRAMTAVLQANQGAASWAASSGNNDAFDTLNAQNIKMAESINKTRQAFNSDKTKLQIAKDNNETKKYVADKQESIARINPG